MTTRIVNQQSETKKANRSKVHVKTLLYDWRYVQIYKTSLYLIFIDLIIHFFIYLFIYLFIYDSLIFFK